MSACSNSSSRIKKQSVQDHVAFISITTTDGEVTCSGAPLQGTKFVLTAAHCVKGARRAYVVADGASLEVVAVRASSTADVAILEVASQMQAGFTLSDGTGPTGPDSGHAKAVGFDRGRELMECGIEVWDSANPRFPCDLLPGASGGPVLVEGGVVGVISTLDSDGKNTAALVSKDAPFTAWPRVEL